MTSKRVIIVGGVAGGASCAARLRRLDEQAEITMFERTGNVSFANCGMPYYLGGVIARREQLLVASPERFRDFFNVEVRTGHEVTRIDREAKTVQVTNLGTGREETCPYDCLVLAPGAAPVRPNLPGIDLPGIFTLRTLDDADRINAWIEERSVTQAVIVGGGYVGLEMAECLSRRGIEVAILEQLGQLMPPMDAEMLAPLYETLAKQGVEVHLNEGAAVFENAADGSLRVVGQSGKKYRADMVLLATGVKPDVKLAQEAGLEIGALGGIRVDEQMRTSDASIWAVGDAVEVRDYVTGQWSLVPLAGPAGRQARVAAEAICGRPARFRGTQGTAVVGVFDLVLAMTGASEKTLRRAGLRYEKSYTHSTDHAGYYPGAQMMAIKLLFSPDDGRVLGAQAVGGAGVARRIDVVAMAIQKQATVYDLEEAQLCYAPQFGSARDAVNIAGSVAANILRGDVEVAHWENVPEKYSGDRQPLILDVRTAGEYAQAAVPGTINIPLGELRTRLGELPQDKEIWVHCGVGQRSYYAVRILRQHGFRVRNLSGGLRTYNMRQAGGGGR